MEKAIWHSMLDADMNARYWKYLVRRHSRLDKWPKIFLAIMASGTVASWQLGETSPLLWKTLSSCSAIVAIALPFLNYQKNIAPMTYLANEWGKLRIAYEDIWLQYEQNPNQVAAAYEKNRRMEANLQVRETKLPDDKKLLLTCFNEVKKSRGLT